MERNFHITMSHGLPLILAQRILMQNHSQIRIDFQYQSEFLISSNAPPCENKSKIEAERGEMKRNKYFHEKFTYLLRFRRESATVEFPTSSFLYIMQSRIKCVL